MDDIGVLQLWGSCVDFLWYGMAWWCNGQGVELVTPNVAGSTPGRSAFKLQPWASCSHTCASVTKQCNLVAVKGR